MRRNEFVAAWLAGFLVGALVLLWLLSSGWAP